MDFTILLVEDNTLQQKIIERHLSNLFDCALEIASTGSDAINYLKTNTPDLIILDGNLRPKNKKCPINGPDVAQVIKTQKPDVPVVLWTDDAKMLNDFDVVFEGERCPEIEKPCRRNNIEAVLTPIVERIMKTKEDKRMQMK
ncbi:response regulator [Legionella fairfieldensis]|uniref:response regulator n=1 Tax=Legionella fairfieldensis TaxID=45064 RepID=UPI00049184B8|nr:response regulator [Legionella fairfieldensis]